MERCTVLFCHPFLSCLHSLGVCLSHIWVASQVRIRKSSKPSPTLFYSVNKPTLQLSPPSCPLLYLYTGVAPLPSLPIFFFLLFSPRSFKKKIKNSLSRVKLFLLSDWYKPSESSCSPPRSQYSHFWYTDLKLCSSQNWKHFKIHITSRSKGSKCPKTTTLCCWWLWLGELIQYSCSLGQGQVLVAWEQPWGCVASVTASVGGEPRQLSAIYHGGRACLFVLPLVPEIENVPEDWLLCSVGNVKPVLHFSPLYALSYDF